MKVPIVFHVHSGHDQHHLPNAGAIIAVFIEKRQKNPPARKRGILTAVLFYL